jgi:hypothetical protein
VPTLVRCEESRRVASKEAGVRSSRSWGILAVIIVFAQACGGGAPEAGSPNTGASEPAEAPKAAQVTVRTAEEPSDPCAWIPVAEVEAVVGKLVEPPSKADGCRYVLTIPEDIAAKRQEHAQRIAAFEARFKTEVPTYHGPMANFQSNPKSYAVSVSVDVLGDMAGEIGLNAGLAHLAREMGGRPTKSAPPEGWDSVSGLPYGFSGRLGHVRVSVQGQAPDVPREVMEKLAAAVRDRIPDLPFKAENPYQVIQLGASDKNPCDLLTRAEAEAVLGPLVVEPYRASSQHPPLALAEGHGCAYYTKGHRVFVLVPEWNDGEQTFKLETGIGSLMSQVLPEEMVVFKGPWEQASISSGTGALLFLKGDSLLTVHYRISSTDRRGAVKLAAAAMRRLVA